MAKKRKQERLKPWCWYCDREFDDEKILIQHQRMKHFKCSVCHRKLNSASGLVIHMAQLHKITMEKVPSAVEGHDTPELEIFGMDGIPQDDLQRHLDGLPIVPYNKTKMILGDSSILPLLAAQKVSVASQLAESKNLIVQGSVSSTIPNPGVNAPPTGVVSPPATASNVIVSPPSTFSTPAVNNPPSVTAQSIPAIPAYPPATGHNPYYAQAANPYYQQYYAQQYAAYYQQYYAQHYGLTGQVSQEPISQSQATIEEAKSIESEAEKESNPLEGQNESSIVVAPIVDEVNNRVVPGIIFTVPCIDRSIEELRSRLKKYKTE